MATLQSTKVVLDRAAHFQHLWFFSATDPDLSGYHRSAQIDEGTYEDLGSPDVITVTIEPGDRLNGG